FADAAFQQQVNEQFEGVRAMEFHLAPPILSRFYKEKTTGHPRKIRLSGWMLPVFRLLAKGKKLRGTKWDVFGYSAERKLERRMIAVYERLLDDSTRRLVPSNHAIAVALAELPLEVKGFGHVKLASYAVAKSREAALMKAFDSPAPMKVAAG